MPDPSPDSLRRRAQDVLDAIDTGCTLGEVRASADGLLGEIDRASV